MADVTFAEADAATVLSEALATYRDETGVNLQPADPRRLFLQTVLSFLAQQRALINTAGRANLVRYSSATYIDGLAELWGLTRNEATESLVTLQWTATTAGVLTIPAGTRATDGTHQWEVVGDSDWAVGDDEADVVSASDQTTVLTRARCTETGADSNDVAIGQIDTIVDPVAGIASVTNTTVTGSGADEESVEDFRTRIRAEPEALSVAGPRGAYQSLAREASADVEDAVALGADDNPDIAGTAIGDGQVRVLIMEVDEDEPSTALKDEVYDYLSAETRRPLTDHVTVQAPELVEYELDVTYYISEENESDVTEIQEAVQEAFEEYKLWQRKIGRDINPSKLHQLLVAAGAHRVETVLEHVPLARDEVGLLVYEALIFGGLEQE